MSSDTYRAWFTTPMGFDYRFNVEAKTKKSAIRKAKKKAPKGSTFRYIGKLKT